MNVASNLSDRTIARRIFLALDVVFLLFIAAVTLYPIIYVVSMSFSDEVAAIQNKVWLLPVNPTLEAYKNVFQYPGLLRSYGNTIFYTIAGTAINIVFTMCAAYPLSRKRFKGRSVFSFLIVFTMLFNGGMIPSYLLVKNLHLLDTRWAILLPGAINTWNMIIMRSFLQQLPEELEEAAKIDGCGDLRLLLQIIVPLSIPSIATITLFYAVAHWNSFFQAMIYLPRAKDLRPLQLILRDIVLQNQTDSMITSASQDVVGLSETIKYATIVVAVAPILCVYPFIQKYFVAGVMVGAVKG